VVSVIVFARLLLCMSSMFLLLRVFGHGVIESVHAWSDCPWKMLFTMRTVRRIAKLLLSVCMHGP